MTLREGLIMGLIEIRTHKMRSFLSFLGVMVGVASVLLTLAFLQGARERMRRGLELSGPGRLVVERRGRGSSWSDEEERRRDRLTLEDARALAREFPELAMVAPRVNFWGRFTFQDLREQMAVVGVTPDFARRDWVYSVRGRFFNGEDLRTYARVCVLIQKGEPGKRSWWRKYYMDYYRDPIDKILRRCDPLGQTVTIGGTAFTVVGVLREPDEDNDPRWFRGWRMWERVLLPLTTLQKYLSGSDDIDDIQIDTGSERTVPFYTGAIMKALSARHMRAEQEFVIRNQAEMMAQSMQEMRKMRYVFLGVGIISLLAGGIGIMNVALAVVYSRIREIGIRRAVGATRMDILVQFVLESILLSFLGGVAGVGLGAAGVWQVPKYWKDFEAILSPSAVAICLGISVAVGLFFSIYPASQASRLDPVEALRYE